MALTAQENLDFSEDINDLRLLPQLSGNPINIEDTDPSIIMSLAWAAYETRNLGVALQYAIGVRKILDNSSQASYLMGLIFMHEGLYFLSERSLKSSLEYSRTKEEILDSAMALAHLYYRMKNYDLMNEYLENVIFNRLVDREDLIPDHVLTAQMQQARLLLHREGLDRVLQLYRWSGHVEAAELLALYAHNQDTYEGYGKAVELFLYSIVTHVGVLIEHIMLYDPEYRFSTLEELLVYSQHYPEMSDYIKNSDLYRTLFLLASSLYAYNQSDVSKIIWNGLRLQFGSNSQWVRRAEIRFFNPQIDRFYEEFESMFDSFN